ncbi:MAG: non-canonical purine NTP pyrophosphatase, partial [Candidatus Omnitrophica bacterium]|nr:non-canonical purine NTP pyrophosphatase [Candidatus Omnitrophota bacterium]
CAIALALPEKIIGVVEGACDGLIAHEEKGMNGFGYDSIFYYPPFEKTFAELTPEEKGRVSHRGEALAMTRSIIIDFLHNRDNT